MVQVSKQEEFSKGGRRFLKLKKMGGEEEEAILKHKIKVRDKNHLTNKKPKLGIISQGRIPIPRIGTNQAKKY